MHIYRSNYHTVSFRLLIIGFDVLRLAVITRKCMILLLQLHVHHHELEYSEAGSSQVTMPVAMQHSLTEMPKEAIGLNSNSLKEKSASVEPPESLDKKKPEAEGEGSPTSDGDQKRSNRRQQRHFRTTFTSYQL